ncbi:hypothetical protein AVEN_43630-1 [Araneus ventricosus]|uniref:Uncharacterized protein n=1 Tax=Araneus ventricosus TaxID=182803 RepID=A0A4Y2QKT5_ARAVE|nr:hypothetical protein AVEN_43630-1 [Araneus ventricosus]
MGKKVLINLTVDMFPKYGKAGDGRLTVQTESLARQDRIDNRKQIRVSSLSTSDSTEVQTLRSMNSICHYYKTLYFQIEWRRNEYRLC